MSQTDFGKITVETSKSEKLGEVVVKGALAGGVLKYLYEEIAPSNFHDKRKNKQQAKAVKRRRFLRRRPKAQTQTVETSRGDSSPDKTAAVKTTDVKNLTAKLEPVKTFSE